MAAVKLRRKNTFTFRTWDHTERRYVNDSFILRYIGAKDGSVITDGIRNLVVCGHRLCVDGDLNVEFNEPLCLGPWRVLVR